MSTELRVTFVEPPRQVRLTRPESDRDQGRRQGGAGSEPATAAADGATATAAPSPPPAEVRTAPEPPPPSDVAARAAAAAAMATAAVPDAAEREAERKRLASVLARLEDEAQRMAERLELDLRSLEGDLVRLALAAAERVVGSALSSGAVDLAALIGAAIGRVAGNIHKKAQIQVRVAPGDRDLIQERLQGAVVDAQRVTLEADPRLLPCTAVVHCELRTVKLDVAEELARLRDSLLATEGERDA